MHLYDHVIANDGWVALDDSDESNGCLVVRDGRGERFMKCSAGDVVVLPSTLEHRSGPNSSNKSRRAYYAQYSAAPIVVGREQVLRLALPCGEEHGPLKKRPSPRLRALMPQTTPC